MPKHKQTKKPLADWNLTGVELKKYKYMLTENTKQCNSDRASASTSHLSWSELRSYAKSLGLSAKGTRAEIELRLAAAADTDESFDFEDKKFNDLPSGSPTKTEPKQAPKAPEPAKVIPMKPGKKAATMSPVPTLALANLARALKNSSRGVAVFSDTFKVLAIAQHFPEIYPGIWKAEFQGSTIGYLQKNADGTYTGYKECPVREPDMDSPNGKFWVDAQGNGEFKVSRVVVTKLSQKTSVHIITTNSHQGGISCDCQGFAYRQHCCHIEAVNTVLHPQEQITQEIEALKIRADLIQEVRDRKLWNLLNLIEPSVLNASLKEIEEGNQILQNALQDALQDAFNVSQIA